MKRPTSTLLLVTGRLVGRADFGPAPECIQGGFWQGPAPQGAGLPEAARQALRLGPRSAKDVWLLTDQVWTQRLYFASAVMAGLGGDELRRAMGFEAESFSGIPALQSRLGVHRLGVVEGAEAFWITQVPSDVAAEAGAAIADAGGAKLRGIVHPGGLSAPLLSMDKTAPFSRVEVWGRATLCIERPDHAPAQVRVINIDPAQPQWREAVDGWLARVAAPPTEWLGPAGTDRVHPAAPLEGEALADFLGLWAKELAAAAPAAPVVLPPPPTVRIGRFVALAAGLLMAVALGCFLDYEIRARQRVAMQNELGSIERTRRETADLATQIVAARKELRQFEAASVTRQAAPAAADDIRLRQERWPALLTAIAGSAGGEVAVSRLTGDTGGAVVLDGLSAAAAAGDTFAARLSQELASKGWTVGAAEKQISVEENRPGLWQFHIQVSPQFQRPGPLPCPPQRW